MSVDHFGGNIVPEITREEHDGVNNAKRVNIVAGGLSFGGLVTLAPSPNFIGIVTVANPGTASLSGNVTLNPSPNFIGIVTVANNRQYVDGADGAGSSTGTVALGGGSDGILKPIPLDNINSAVRVNIVTGTLNVGQSGGWNTDLNAGANFIGLVTVGGGYLTSYPQVWNGSAFEAIDRTVFIGLVTAKLASAWSDPQAYIGLVTATLAGSVNTGMTTIFPGPNQIGSVTVSHPVSLGAGAQFVGLMTVVQSSAARSIVGNLTLSNPNNYIGLVTATLGVGTRFIGIVTVVQSSAARTITGNITLSNPNAYIGLTTSTLGVGTQFIGLVTANALIAGTTKTLINLPIAFSSSSVATIAVPTNANRINITNLILNSNATVRITFKSGVTYLTGNASIGITLNPGGGFPLTGSPDSPSWIGLPSGALVIEKLDLTSTIASIAGNVMYFQEA